MKKLLDKVFTVRFFSLVFTVGEILIESHPQTNYKPVLKIAEALVQYASGST